MQFYSYLNLESTKTAFIIFLSLFEFYSYLNLESTKTNKSVGFRKGQVL